MQVRSLVRELRTYILCRAKKKFFLKKRKYEKYNYTQFQYSEVDILTYFVLTFFLGVHA